MNVIFWIFIGLLGSLTVVILYSALVAASDADDIEEQALEQERKRHAERFWEKGDE